MVRITGVCHGQMKTFGWRMSPFRHPSFKHKIWNHRKPLRYQRFMAEIDPEEIVEHYSRDDLDQIQSQLVRRTYKDAQQTMSRKNFLLPNLSDHDLEMNNLFQKELERQRSIIARIDKIRVIIDSQPGKGTELAMNKDLSTPYDCARHIHDLLITRSVVAELCPIDDINESSSSEIESHQTTDDSELTDNSAKSELLETDNRQVQLPRPAKQANYWDMHRPLEADCRLKFRHFVDSDLGEVNKIYWRSCSFVLGMAIRRAFKDEVKVLLHSWPKPNVRSGSFVYDVALNLKDRWQPSEQELRALTKLMWEIKEHELPFERLTVSRDVAQKMFEYNPFKRAQINSIAGNESSQGKVTVYRCGGLLDMSVGPMISNTSQIGRISLAAVHPFDIDSDAHQGLFYRFQGISLPQQLPMSSYLYQNVLLNQAKKLNVVAH